MIRLKIILPQLCEKELVLVHLYIQKVILKLIVYLDNYGTMILNLVAHVISVECCDIVIYLLILLYLVLLL